MKLYSYVVTHDYGFAPNPFGGTLTLATCMPQIRRSAKKGDWFMGTGSVYGIGTNRLIYLARITDIVPISEYSTSQKYEFKIPGATKDKWSRRGDNIYTKSKSGRWVQRDNPFHGPNEMEHDLSGKNVLISDEFWYFGDQALDILEEHICLVKKGPNCKANENLKEAKSFIDYVNGFPNGIVGKPSSMRPKSPDQ